MSNDACEFVQNLLNDGDAVGFIPGGALGPILQAWGSLHGDDGVLRMRLPYQPGRKDRQLASVLLQALGKPALLRGVSTEKAWENLAGQWGQCGCRLVVIENADMLDRHGLLYVNRRYFPVLILVGGERLTQRISRHATPATRILSWPVESPGSA